jgi:hypothetical protein
MPEKPRTVQRKKSQYIANESFVANRVDGDPTTATQYFMGRSRVTDSDSVYMRYPHLFDLLEDHDAIPNYDPVTY